MMDYLAKNISFGFFLVKILPLQIQYYFRGNTKKMSSWLRKMKYHKLEKDCVEAAIKVSRWYGKLGFKPVLNGLFMARNRINSTMREHSAPDEILDAKQIE